jgi:hypothetical protein
MKDYPNDEWLDEMSPHIQEAVSQVKRDKRRNDYGMKFEFTDSRLSRH